MILTCSNCQTEQEITGNKSWVCHNQECRAWNKYPAEEDNVLVDIDSEKEVKNTKKGKRWLE